MAKISAYCPHCGAVFASRAFGFSGPVGSLRLAGNKETCLNCGEMANIIDGTFDLSFDDVSLISGPDISRAILKEFAGLVDRAAKDEIDSDQLQTEAEKLDPKLGQLVANVRKKHFGIATLVILMMFLNRCNFDVKLDLNQLFDQWTNHGAKQVYVPSADMEVKDSKGFSDSKATSDGLQNKDGSTRVQ